MMPPPFTTYRQDFGLGDDLAPAGLVPCRCLIQTPGMRRPFLDGSKIIAVEFLVRGLAMHYHRLLVSILIISVIGIHALPAVKKLQGETQTLWPFLAWGMYRNSRDPGPIVTAVTRIIGVTSNGASTQVDANLVGVSSFVLKRLYIDPMLAGNLSVAQRLADRLNHEREDPFVRFRLETESHTLTDAGIAKDYNSFVLEIVTHARTDANTVKEYNSVLSTNPSLKNLGVLQR
jgi:hypothetical protein